MIKSAEGLLGMLGLEAGVNHSYDVVHAFYSDLSERFGNCSQMSESDQAGPQRPAQSVVLTSGSSALHTPSL